MRRLLPLLLLAPVTLVAGCESTKSFRSASGAGEMGSEAALADVQPQGPAIRVAYRQYKDGMEFELVSESHTSRARLYSQYAEPGQGLTKVGDDEIMGALVQALESRDIGIRDGFRQGRAARDGRGVLWQMLEIEDADGTRHFVIGNGSSTDDVEAMRMGAKAFFGVYNTTTGYQTIRNRDGRVFGSGLGAPGSQDR